MLWVKEEVETKDVESWGRWWGGDSGSGSGVGELGPITLIGWVRSGMQDALGEGGYIWGHGRNNGMRRESGPIEEGRQNYGRG